MSKLSLTHLTACVLSFEGGGPYDNILNGSNASEMLVGGNGSDKIVAKGGIDIVFGDGPLVIDTYYGNYVGVRALADEEITLGNDVINGGTGPNDQLASNGIFEWAYFGDILSGDSQYSVALAGATIHFGNDKIVGAVGNDLIYGDMVSDVDFVEFSGGGTYDFGDDKIESGSGDDAIMGDASILGNFPPTTSTYFMGNDLIKAGEGNDVLLGDVSQLYSGTAAFGNDSLEGDQGDDVLVGDAVVVAGFFMDTTVCVLGDDTLNGGNGADALYGDVVAAFGNVSVSGGNDVLRGGAGNDDLLGGYGNDVLTGGSGADNFWFDTPLDALLNVDRVTDFARGLDKIVLSGSVFSTLASGDLASTAFALAGAAQTADTRIIFDATTGALSYDADGTGTTDSPVQFATLVGHHDIGYADFLVY